METFLLRISCRGEQVPLSQPEARKEIFSQSQKSKMFFSSIDKVRIESWLLRKRLLLFYLPDPPRLESRKIFPEETSKKTKLMRSWKVFKGSSVPAQEQAGAPLFPRAADEMRTLATCIHHYFPSTLKHRNTLTADQTGLPCFEGLT